MKGSANRGRTRLERSTGAHLSAGAFCCLTAWTGPVWVPRNPSCSWCGVGRRAFAQTGPRAVISAHIQASIVNPVFVERLVRFVRIYPLRYGLSFQVSYLNNPTPLGTQATDILVNLPKHGNSQFDVEAISLLFRN